MLETPRRAFRFHCWTRLNCAKMRGGTGIRTHESTRAGTLSGFARGRSFRHTRARARDRGERAGRGSTSGYRAHPSLCPPGPTAVRIGFFPAGASPARPQHELAAYAAIAFAQRSPGKAGLCAQRIRLAWIERPIELGSFARRRAGTKRGGPPGPASARRRPCYVARRSHVRSRLVPALGVDEDG